MERIAKFEKVSRGQFTEAWKKNFGADSDADTVYDRIVLPKRATVGSAGYDFFAPGDFELWPGEQITIPTGIRVSMREGWCFRFFRGAVSASNTVCSSTTQSELLTATITAATTKGIFL